MILLPAPETTRLSVAPMMDWLDAAGFGIPVMNLRSIGARL
jgi:hypothetical protein